MIIKLAGMAVVMLSSVLIGFGFAECMASRERELRNLADGAELMIGELCYASASVRELMYICAPRINGLAGELFDYICSLLKTADCVSFAWEEALRVKAPSMSLKKEDADTLISCSYLLEAKELDEQKKCLGELKARIAGLAEEAMVSKKKNSRTVRMLGVYGGMLLCVIMF